MSYPIRRGRARATTCALLAIVLSFASVGIVHGEGDPGLDQWAFVIGEWELVENRYSFEGELMQTNAGHSEFSYTMNGQRIQELQQLAHGDDEITVLHIFVYDPRSEEIEIARTDSGHYGFWLISGTMTEDRIDLKEMHPNPSSDVTRRITYHRGDDSNFSRQLEFSTDKGETWFVRSEWKYTRK